MGEMYTLAALARRLDPAAINNVVMQGKTGTASGGQSVVYPGESAAAMWGDLRDDARLTGSYGSPNQGGGNTGGDGTGGSDDTTPTTEYYEEPTTTMPEETTTTTRSGGIFGGGTTTTTEYAP
jgi:hypothetical protein